MSNEFEKLEALLYLSEPNEREPQVDRGEAANSPPDGGGWPVVLASGVLSFFICDCRTEALLGLVMARQVAYKAREATTPRSMELRSGLCRP